MTNVFISHSNSRYDMDFVRDLGEALTRRGYEVFVDIMDLPVGATLGDSPNVTRSQIEDADAFIFVISPDSVKWGLPCHEELSYAVEYNKRLMPIVRRDVDREALPVPLGRVVSLPFREDDDFDQALQYLVEAINR